MSTLFQQGRFVIVEQGRMAGKKALVLASYPGGSEDRKYPYAIVLGIEKCPRRVNKEMSTETLVKKTQVKPFIKVMNLNHLLLTRHVVRDPQFWANLETEKLISAMGDPAEKKKQLEVTGAALRQKYLNDMNPWFFTQLKF